jgi:metal-responsive CopG/Arc/MetJ family transcriptional regulator
MRLHISLADELVAELDQRVGRRRRSEFIAETLRHALDDRRRWDEIESALGSVSPAEHEWDADPGAWVRAQRGADERRVG